MEKRRSNGEGHITKLPSGRYQCRILIGKKPDGKPIIRKRSFGTPKEALKWAMEASSLHNPDAQGLAEKPLQEYMKLWMENYKRTAVAASTYDSIADALNRMSQYPVAHEKLCRVNSGGLQAMLDSMAEDGFSEGTVKKTLEWVKNCLRYAVDEEHIVKDPTRQVHIPAEEHFKTKKKQIEAFTAEEQRMLEEEALRTSGTGSLIYRYGPAFVLLLYTGMRVSEMCALQWKHLVCANGKWFLSIQEAMRESRTRSDDKTAPRYQHYRGKPKTASSIREIPLNARAMEMLELLKKQCGSYITPEDCIVQTETHHAADRNNIGRCYRSMAKAVGISGPGGVHRARHTFATRLVERNNPSKVIADLMGHASQRTTEIYMSSSQEGNIRAIDSL